MNLTQTKVRRRTIHYTGRWTIYMKKVPLKREVLFLYTRAREKFNRKQE